MAYFLAKTAVRPWSTIIEDSMCGAESLPRKKRLVPSRGAIIPAGGKIADYDAGTNRVHHVRSNAGR
jgi:hypothetical protein